MLVLVVLRALHAAANREKDRSKGMEPEVYKAERTNKENV